MKEWIEVVLTVVAVITGFFGLVYLGGVVVTTLSNADKKIKACEYVEGKVDKGKNGNYYIAKPWTLGVEGSCWISDYDESKFD